MRFYRILVAVITLGLLAGVTTASAQLTQSKSTASSSGVAGDRPVKTTYQSIVSCRMPGQAVWPTFDDGGSRQQVNGILRVLRQENVRAIFFPVGEWASWNKGLVRKMVRQGHLLGNHSATHADMTTLSNKGVRREIAGGVQGTTDPKLFRPPYGAGAFDSRIQNVAASMGYQICFWTVDTRDWAGASAKSIVRRIKHGEAGVTPPIRKNGVFLLHMQAPHTVEALPGVIEAIKAKGLKLPKLR